MSRSEEDFHPNRIVWMTPDDAGNTTEDGDNRGGRKHCKYDTWYYNDCPKLCKWAQEKMGLSNLPDLAVALSGK